MGGFEQVVYITTVKRTMLPPAPRHLQAVQGGCATTPPDGYPTFARTAGSLRSRGLDAGKWGGVA